MAVRIAAVDAMGVEEPSTLASGTKSDAHRGAGHPTQKTGAKKTLQIDDQVKARRAEGFEEADKLPGRTRTAADSTVSRAIKQDEFVEFDEFYDEEPIPVAELEDELELDFEPDGTSSSARWVLRSEDGRGVEMTLDGRLGRVQIEPVERLDPDSLERPEPLEEEEEEEYEEDQDPLEERT